MKRVLIIILMLFSFINVNASELDNVKNSISNTELNKNMIVLFVGTALITFGSIGVCFSMNNKEMPVSELSNSELEQMINELTDNKKNPVNDSEII